MMNRKERRAAEHAARKAARKAGFPIVIPNQIIPNQTILVQPIANPVVDSAANESAPAPEKRELSEAQLAANRANAKLSHGPTSSAGLAISSQNRTVHGLARINGNFRLLSSEDPNAFEAFKQSLAGEHQPATPTESVLINGMAESHWLAARAESLQNTCIDPATGVITDEKKASLYLRYQTTHTRAFHKCLHDLLKLRSEREKTRRGIESHSIQKEKHEMKKVTHDCDVFGREAASQLTICRLTTEKIRARREFPDFEAEFAVELAKQAAAAA